MERQNADTDTVHELMPRTIVCLYAQADEPFYFQLKKSLNLWERGGQVCWLEVLPGDEPAATWQRDVQRADLILLLMSPDFFPDDLCYHTMHLALQERVTRQVPIVPVVIRAVDWRASACKDLSVVPRNEQPVASWTSPDEAFASIGADLARLLPAWGLLVPSRSTVFRVPDLPEGYVPRPRAFQEIKSAVLGKRMAQTLAITTALRGAGGFGKTTLAIALCHDPDIQAAFPEILWVELGEQPPRVLDLLNRLLTLLESSPVEALTLQEARERWHMALRDRVCLLVIDDAWQAEVLLPLLEGGSQCVRLVTTRNDLLLPNNAARVLVDAMELGEAVTLLCQDKYLPAEIFQVRHQPQLEALVERLGCWPLLLTLARGMLTDLVIEYHLSIAEALTTIVEAYQTRGVTAFRLDNGEERQRTVDACLRVSVQHLETFTHPHYHAIERYQELAVFPEDTDIPLATLQVYWKRSAGLEPWETKDLCIRLHRLSLLLTCDLVVGTIRLHDVVRNYLIQRVGSHLPALHRRLLDACQQGYGLTRWANLPRSEAYLWQHLVFHLCRAGRPEALQTTLTDLLYVIHKALYLGVSALEADLVLAATASLNEDVEQPSPQLVSLHRAIMRIHHLLQQVSTKAEIGGLLLSYLKEEECLTTQRLVLERELPHPFLVAWHPLPRIFSAALLRTLHGHTGWVHGCAISPDGKWIASASLDDTLKVWEAATGEERLTLKGHTGGVHACAFSPDGKWIVSASDDNSLKVWEAATGEEHLTLKGHSKDIHACAFSPDGKWIVSASDDRTLKVWETATGEERLTLRGHTDLIYSGVFSPDRKWIVSASFDQTLKVWEAATGEEHLTLKGHTGPVEGCAFSPDGKWILSASWDSTLRLWEAATGEERITFRGHTDTIRDCAFSPDGKWIVSAAWDSTLKVWEVAAREEHLTLKDYTDWVRACAVSPDGKWVVSGSDAGTLKVWDTNTGTELRTLSGHTSTIWSCAFSSDGKWIVSASGDQTLKVWKTATGEERLTLRGHTGMVENCTFSPDGKWIVSASYDGTLRVWEAATGEELLTLRGHTDLVLACAFSPDGKWIVSASKDQTLKVWEAATGEERLTLKGHTSTVYACAFSPDGKWIVSASGDDTLKVWEATTGEESLILRGHTSDVWSCAVSPDGKWIISASHDHTFKVWEGWTGQSVLTFPVDERLSGCAFHPDGEHIIACGRLGMYFLRLVV